MDTICFDTFVPEKNSVANHCPITSWYFGQWCVMGQISRWCTKPHLAKGLFERSIMDLNRRNYWKRWKGSFLYCFALPEPCLGKHFLLLISLLRLRIWRKCAAISDNHFMDYEGDKVLSYDGFELMQFLESSCRNGRPGTGSLLALLSNELASKCFLPKDNIHCER